MRIRRLLGTALTVLMLIGGLLLVTAGPAAACSYPPRPASEASYAARADAVFVGTLVSRVDRIDRIAAAARAELARERQRRPYRADRVTELMRQVTQRSGRAVLTFEVRRVYQGTVGKRQEVIGFGSLGPCARPRPGDGRFLIFANKPSSAISRQYQLDPGQYTFSPGSRALADGGEPDLGRPEWLAPDSIVVGVAVLGIAAGLALATLRARRHLSAD